MKIDPNGRYRTEQFTNLAALVCSLEADLNELSHRLAMADDRIAALVEENDKLRRIIEEPEDHGPEDVP